jgi:hypothetical protein
MDYQFDALETKNRILFILKLYVTEYFFNKVGIVSAA